MSRQKTLFNILYFSIALASLDFLALGFSLFWRLWWFDLPMHMLGGFIFGLIFLSIYSFGGAFNLSRNGFAHLLWATLAGVFVAGVAWEMFEYYGGLTFQILGNYQFDTIKDIGMDVLGGYMAYKYF